MLEGKGGKISSRIGVVGKALSSIAVKRTHGIKDCIAGNCDFSSTIHATTFSIRYISRRSDVANVCGSFRHHTYTDRWTAGFLCPSFQITLIFVIIFLSFLYFFLPFSLYFLDHFIVHSLYYLFSFFSSLFFLFSFSFLLFFHLFSSYPLFSFFFVLGSFVTPLLDVLKLFQHFTVLLHASFKVLSRSRRYIAHGSNGRQLSTRARVCVCVSELI